MRTKLTSARGLRWVFAETLVIVLGVLIALGLNDYWTKRQENLLAIDYIKRIQVDIEWDLGYVREVLLPKLLLKQESLQVILPVLRGLEPVPDDLVAFFGHIGRAGILGASASPWYADTTFQDLGSTGNIRVITNADIREDIADYYENLEARSINIQFRLTGYVSFVHTVIPAELREDINMEALEEFGIDFALKRLMSDEFRALANEEYNFMLYMNDLDFEGRALAFEKELEAYLQELEGS